MNRRKRTEKFHKQVTSYRYRNPKTGAYVSQLTKAGTKRKNVRREKIQTLFTVVKETGEIRKYGMIREPSRQSLARSQMKNKNFYLKGFFMQGKIWEKAAERRATGVVVTVKGTSGRNKDTAIRVKIIFDQDKLGDQEHMQAVVLAKLMRRLADRNLRLSDLQITSHKKYSQMKDVSVQVDYFSEGEDDQDDGDDGQEETSWEGEDSSISEAPKRKRRRGRRKKRSRKPKRLRLTRRTTRKGKYR